ncbi:MAG: hypothetical protein K0Q65_1315 [Clostridia bacterium]|jgi:hypothetical protein|nr:hypothetical protein [Clostridia bacterium]
MQYFNWNKHCPYAALYGYGYPAVDRQYNYFIPFTHELNEYQWYFDEYSEMWDSEADSKSADRAQRDIERVLPIVFQNAANEVNQAIALGMKPNLIAYFIREMVEYIDRNYGQYDLTYSYNVTQASEGIKRDLYWIFNILRVYGMPFEAQKNLLNHVVITSLQNLRVPAGTAGAPTA